MNINELQEIFKNTEIDNDKVVIKDDFLNIMELVKNTYHFDMLREIIAVDNGEAGIELIYNLYSTENEEELKISVTVNEEALSVSKLFDSAVADENEIYDLFGVKFTGNDKLKRLYLPESWEGHPLRKDYEEKDERLRWNE